MLAFKEVVASRVGRHHRICGYCHKEMPSSSSLRRHIRERQQHETYRHFLELLYTRLEPISQTQTADPWNPSTYHLLGGEFGKKAEPIEMQNVLSRPSADVADLCTEIKEMGLLPLAEAIKNTSLSCLNSCTSSVLQIWEAVGGLPVVFPSSKMYFGERRHRDKHLFVQYLSSTRVRLFVNGVEDPQLCPASKKQMLYELAYEYRSDGPSDSRISAAFSLREDNFMFVPRLAVDPLAQGQEESEVILTSKGGLTDLHIGAYTWLRSAAGMN